MNQNTIKSKISFSGTGIHSGETISMTLNPAPENYGIVFVRSDLKGKQNVIAASFENVTKVNMCTTIENADGAMVSTVEHIMSALWACEIDNVKIEINGPEVPIMDGSSAKFIEALREIGISQQTAPRKFIKILQPIDATIDDKKIELQPSNDFEINYTLNVEHKNIGTQHFVFKNQSKNYDSDIGKARTYGFVKDIEALQKMGFGKGASLDNAVGLTESGIANTEGLRFEDEFVRHKVLDCIGDLYLAGSRIIGKINSCNSNHALNNKLLRKLFANPASYEIVDCV